MAARAPAAQRTRKSPPTLGIDIGGTGIKGAPVDLATGTLAAPRRRIVTPQPSTPHAVAAVVAEIAAGFLTETGPGPIGITYPGVVKGGIVKTAANVDKGWIGLDAATLFREATGRTAVVINDAQAAVMAEARYGAGAAVDGIVLMLTFGTGIGSGLVIDGRAVEGVELGHISIDGADAELLAAASVRDSLHLSWKQWAKRVNRYLDHIETILWPDIIIVGGGVSEKAEKWLPYLKTRTPVVAATLHNSAGIVGAVLATRPIAASPSNPTLR